MSPKILSHWLVGISVIAILAFVMSTAIPAQAQCGTPPTSSCATCHAEQDPVNENGEWHIIHADQDICINCHGGNATAEDKDLAHENLAAHPLDDIYTDCHGCHPDYDERAAQFAPVLGVTPSSCATPTPIPANTTSGESPSNGIHVPADTANTSEPLQPLLVFGATFIVLFIFSFGLGWFSGHR